MYLMIKVQLNILLVVQFVLPAGNIRTHIMTSATGLKWIKVHVQPYDALANRHPSNALRMPWHNA